MAPAFDLDFVTPELAVGGRLPLQAAAVLGCAHGVRAVVDLRVEERDDERAFRAHGIAFLHLPTADARAVSQAMLDDGVAWVSAHIDRGEKVLVHCEHGVGRSALLALCVLVARGDSPLGALERAKGARPMVSPSPEQLEAFAAWARSFAARTGGDPEVPTVDALGRVAWRHLQPGEQGTGTT
jgi:predicted protein tyrosine phosphatase